MTVAPVAGIFLASMLVLAVGGVLKVVRPLPSSSALKAVGLPSTPMLVRLLGVVEITVAVSAVIFNETLLYASAAVLYMSFAAFVLLALRRGTSLQSCGCFGKIDTPPSSYHVAVNVALAASAALMIGSSNSVGQFLLANPLDAVPTLVMATVGAYVVYVSLTALPEVALVIQQRASS